MGIDLAAAKWLLTHQCGVLTRAQILSIGMTEDGLRHRIRRGGRWHTGAAFATFRSRVM
jgi:hypothetical protein